MTVVTLSKNLAHVVETKKKFCDSKVSHCDVSEFQSVTHYCKNYVYIGLFTPDIACFCVKKACFVCFVTLVTLITINLY